MTPPAMNTRSKKRLTARHALETNTDKILIDSEHFFTLANMMDDDSSSILSNATHVFTTFRTSALMTLKKDYG